MSNPSPLPDWLESWHAERDLPPQFNEPEADQTPLPVKPETAQPAEERNQGNVGLSDSDRSHLPVMPTKPPVGFETAAEWMWMNSIPWAWVYGPAARRVRESFETHFKKDPNQDQVNLWKTLCTREAERWAAERLRKTSKAVPEKSVRLLAKVLHDELNGVGARLEPLIRSRLYTDIIIQGNENSVLRPRAGGPPMIGPRIWDTEKRGVDAVNALASTQNREFSFATPTFDGQTPSGERVHAVFALSDRLRVTIRCHDMGLASFEQLRGYNTIDEVLERMLTAAVKAKLNIIVSGATGTGKTTLLRAMINQIDPTENIFTVEDSPELSVFETFKHLHPCGEAMVARQANLDGEGAVTMDALVKETLRMTPDRVIVGEVRGREALSMVMAMSQGNDGSLCSLHSNNALDTLSRLQVYISQHPDRPGDKEIEMLISKAVHLVVHVRRMGNRRAVSEVMEVTGYQEDRITFSPIYEDVGGVAKLTGNCEMSTLLRDKLAAQGFTLAEYRQGLKWKTPRGAAA